MRGGVRLARLGAGCVDLAPALVPFFPLVGATLAGEGVGYSGLALVFLFGGWGGLGMLVVLVVNGWFRPTCAGSRRRSTSRAALVGIVLMAFPVILTRNRTAR